MCLAVLPPELPGLAYASGSTNGGHQVSLDSLQGHSRTRPISLMPNEHLAQLRDHQRDSSDSRRWLVQLDVVAALLGNQLLTVR